MFINSPSLGTPVLGSRHIENIKGQVLADFIVEHGIDLDDDINYLTFMP